MNTAPGEGEIWTVTQVVQKIQLLLAQEIPPLWVEGEISNYSRSGAGHRYFTLKDDRNQLRIAFFRGRARGLKFEPADGQKVLVFGRVDIYGPRSEFQAIAERLLPVGAGELELAFKQLHARLAAEGLFSAERKRALPLFPRRLGIVTSARGAAVRDILKVLRRRAPHVETVIADTPVQGDRAAAQIAAAIELFNRAQNVDLLLVGRGGGSLEDLWPFNEEAVVRAVVASRLPVVSGVGHEVDVTLCDLAADLRAATPTAAAELAVRDRREWLAELADYRRRLGTELGGRIAESRRHLYQVTQRYGFRRPQDALQVFHQTVDRLSRRLARSGQLAVQYRARSLDSVSSRPGLHRPSEWLTPRRQALDKAAMALRSHGRERVSHGRERLARVQGALVALSPRSVLERGYAVVLNVSDQVVSSIKQAQVGAKITAIVKDGRVDASVESKEATDKWL
jgi:exodeoxyribonuclease VII large subunit